MILAKSGYEQQQNSQHGTYMLAQSEDGNKEAVFVPGAVRLDEHEALAWKLGRA